jgi:hypothetical protein
VTFNYGRGRIGGDDRKFSDIRRDRGPRSPEALERRREERLDRSPWVKPPRPTIVSVVPSAPKPPPIPDDMLLDAERRLEFGARVIVSAFVDDVRGALRVSFQDATAVVNELISQGRLTRNVASNGFVTLSRQSGCRRAK